MKWLRPPLADRDVCMSGVTVRRLPLSTDAILLSIGSLSVSVCTVAANPIKTLLSISAFEVGSQHLKLVCSYTESSFICSAGTKTWHSGYPSTV